MSICVLRVRHLRRIADALRQKHDENMMVVRMFSFCAR
jgi:hypothetical protein